MKQIHLKSKIMNASMRMYFRHAILCLFLLGLLSCGGDNSKRINESPNVQILFLGHDSEHHNSEQYMPMLASALVKNGIQFTYTSNPDDLNKDNLAKFDGLAVYANIDEISSEQEKAMLDFVGSGKGLIPIHCASFCFRNSNEYVSIVGGQFKKHGKGTFIANLTPSGKEMLKGFNEFETWDETYVHQNINPSIDILMERKDGDHIEPWTWTNEYKDGRMFYTAYGHDERTWNNPGFHDLMKRGILWAVGDKAAGKAAKLSFPQPKYSEAKIPNYEKRDPPLKLQQGLSPEESMQLTQVPIGFELELFAAEPDIINPIAMAWDERGRLWVIETVDYPNTVRSDDGVGDDRVKICEDTNGDGKADKFTVFAEGLNIPTSIVFANGGIIVSQAPHFLFLKDTNGDDKADVRETLITGWGTYDTHAGPSNLKYGFDNKIWGTVGYSSFDGVVDGTPTKFRQGIFSFNRDGSGLQQLTKTSNNTWGLGFSENFDVFASTANNTHSVFMGIPNKYLAGVKGLDDNGSKKIDGHYAFHPISNEVRQVDVFGGFTAAAGHNLYTARSFPSNYWNRVALVCEPTGRLIHNAILEEDGAGFKEKDGWNLTASNDNWFGPVHAEVGPDGAVWIADWYNFIIQHNPTPPGFENGSGNAHINPLRDKKHGRIYKLVYKGAKPYKKLSLSIDDTDGLIAALQNDNLFWRLTAQRLLVERNEKDVVSDLLALINDKSVDEIGINPGAIHALWTLHGLGVLADPMAEDVSNTVVGALKHPSAGVRKAAVQVLPKTEWASQAIQSSGILKDKNKNTQLAAILVISEMPQSSEIGVILFELGQNKEVEQDEWLSQAVYIAAAKHKSGFVQAVKQMQPALVEEVLYQSQSKPQERWQFDLDVSSWNKVEVPGYWEETEIGNVDGIIWFRKEFNLSPAQKGLSATLDLGTIDDSDETWVNGVRIGGEGKYDTFRSYKVPTGLLKSGKNVVAVKVTDTGSGGGFWSNPDDVKLKIKGKSIALAGKWSYQIEEIKGGKAKTTFNEQNPIAKVFLKNYYNESDIESTGEIVGNQAAPVKVITIKPIVNEMKYDLKSFEVEAGQQVEIRFKNIDFMQHNLLILSPNSLETVGAAADKMASAKNGAANNYVPSIPQVLFATKLVDPDTEAVLRFKVPEKAGDYPFVCTFPGHWRIMNGIMKVTAKKSI